jgi:hypothetical protein
MTGELYILQAHPAAILALDIDNGKVRIAVAHPAGVPDGIQVDGLRNAIYWTNMGPWGTNGDDFSRADGTIERCDLDGGNHRVLVGGGAIVTPKQMQLDAESGFLYWCDREGMAVLRSGIDGSDLTELRDTGEWPGQMGEVERHCVGIALDKRNRHLFWTQKGPPDGGLGRIFRMGLEMPEGATAKTRGDVALLIDHLPEPIDLEVDHEHGQLYWTDRGDPESGGNSINRANITPEGLSDHAVLATGLKEGIGLALDLRSRRIFVSDLSGAIRVMAMDGGALKTIHQCSGPVTGIALSSTSGA